MKVRYYKAKKRKVQGSDPTTFPFYVQMDKVMGDRLLFNTLDHMDVVNAGLNQITFFHLNAISNQTDANEIKKKTKTKNRQ